MNKIDKLPDINCKVIPHKSQRYDTLGDFFLTRKTMQFRVSDMGDWRTEFAVLIHELVEWGLCRHYGVTLDAIDKHDFWFESEGLPGEPGEHPQCPYRVPHALATVLERMLVGELELKWSEYEKQLSEVK